MQDIISKSNSNIIGETLIILILQYGEYTRANTTFDGGIGWGFLKDIKHKMIQMIEPFNPES